RLGAAAGVELRVAAVGGAAGDPETAVADDGLHQTRVVGQDEWRGDLQLDDRRARQRGLDHLDIGGGRQHDGTVHRVLAEEAERAMARRHRGLPAALGRERQGKLAAEQWWQAFVDLDRNRRGRSVDSAVDPETLALEWRDRQPDLRSE